MKRRSSVDGVITIVQEDRFRLRADDGRGLLFTLYRGANANSEDLTRLARTGDRVRVEYEGIPDVNALARRLDTV